MKRSLSSTALPRSPFFEHIHTLLEQNYEVRLTL